MTDYRERLYLGKVDAIEGKDGQHLAQRTFFVRKREYEARLVCLIYRTKEICFSRIAHHEEASVIMLVVLYVVFQHLQSVISCSIRMADGCPALLAEATDLFC